MKLGERLRGAAKRARNRLRIARRNPRTTKARKRQARRTAMYWNRRLREFRAELKRKAQAAKRGDSLWGGSRRITNEIVAIVDGRAPVTSRKRWALFGNPSSDHYMGNTSADAVDFGIAEAHWLKNEISRRLGGPASLADYESFVVFRKGKQYRVQLIAGTHGTGPHLHSGVKRI